MSTELGVSRTATSCDPYRSSQFEGTSLSSASIMILAFAIPHRFSSSVVVGMFCTSAGVPVVGNTAGTAELHVAAVVGKKVGNFVCRVGSCVGDSVGLVGLCVGSCVGRCVGGTCVGAAVGISEVNCFNFVGLKVGDGVGEAVGATSQRQRSNGEQKP